MDLAVMLTYRCNSRCAMCHLWQHPTLPEEEITPALLAKLPKGFSTITLTGGEPTLRDDLEEIVDVLHPKTRRLDIYTNGLQAEILEKMAQKYPKTRFWVGMDGLLTKNDQIRGEQDGFSQKTELFGRFFAVGAKNLGISVTIQDENCDKLTDLLRWSQKRDVCLSATALHNGFQFHKIDNEPYNRMRTARATQQLAVELLASRRPQNWLRAYSLIGLMRKILGQPRLIRCTAGRDFVCLDPWGRLYACNVRPDLEMGDLTAQSWRQIMRSPQAAAARTRVARCTHNCWMPESARAAFRRRCWPRRVRFQAFRWIFLNRWRLWRGQPVRFEPLVDFHDIAPSPVAPRRTSWLDRPFTPAPQKKTEAPYGAFNHVMNK